QRGGLFLEALDAGADSGQRLLGRAMRARLRGRHGETAMMAHQPVTEAVIDQPRVADGAGEAMAAGPAQRQRRIAAPIKEQQRLFLPLDRKPDLFGEAGGDEVAAWRRLPPQIDRLDTRHVLAAEPRW